MRKILVVAVHPDDETLGCGGTLLKHQAENDEVVWLICTQSLPEAESESRQNEINTVAGLYRFSKTIQLGLTAAEVDSYPTDKLIKLISQVVHEVKPHTIYLPFRHDVHSDHRKIFEAAYSCTKSFRYPFIKKILMMETLSETEFAPATQDNAFVPNVFIDISAHMKKKQAILRVYQSEMAEHPFPRSERNVAALATLRGATSGCEYAESFVLLKEIG